MNLKIKFLSSLFVLLATGSLFPSIATADTPANKHKYQSVNHVFERALFKNYPNYFGDNTFERDINMIFGPGSLFQNSFPENEIARDGELVDIVYKDALHQQATNDPYIRTPDLPNPYNSSLLASPGYNAEKLKLGTEFRFGQP